MDEQKEFEYAQSEEGRNAILNQLLERSESLARARQTVRDLNTLTFNELTPEIWAIFQGRVQDIHMQLEIVGEVIQNSAKMLDDDEAVRTVVRLATNMDEES